MRIAAAQIECRPGDIAGNLRQHLAMMDRARDAGCELLVFPELSLTDYMRDPPLDALARSRDCEELAAIADAAGGMLVSAGFIERAADGRVFNAQALIARDGVRHIHRKANLPHYGRLTETKHYTKGERIEPVALRDGLTAATLICADTWNPALPWLAALQDISLLLVPIASAENVVDSFDSAAGWDMNLRHTALTYGMPVVMANHCGARADGIRFWGGSRILDAFGREIARLTQSPGLAMADLNLAEVKTARERLPTMRDADPLFVQAELARILDARR